MIFSDFVKKKCSRIALKQIVGFIVPPAPVQKMNTTFQRIVLGTKKRRGYARRHVPFLGVSMKNFYSLIT